MGFTVIRLLLEEEKNAREEEEAYKIDFTRAFL